MDAKTINVHYNGHHMGYSNKLNDLLQGTSLYDTKLEELLLQPELIAGFAQEQQRAILANAGGVYNHNLFWSNLTPNESKCTGAIYQLVIREFGSIDSLLSRITEAASNHIGSGWIWLALVNNTLKLVKTHDHICPVSFGHYPILCLDIWEHAYYLNCENDKTLWCVNWFQLIDWNKINKVLSRL